MSTRHVASGLIAAALVAGCQSAGPHFSSQDEATLRAMADTTVQAFKSARFAPWLALWVDDAVLQPPNARSIVGRPALESWAKSFPTIEDLSFFDIKVTGDGNMAYVTTAYSLKVKGTPADSGKQLVVARRQTDGAWKFVAGNFNSELPPPPTPLVAAPTKSGAKK